MVGFLFFFLLLLLEEKSFWMRKWINNKYIETEIWLFKKSISLLIFVKKKRVYISGMLGNFLDAKQGMSLKKTIFIYFLSQILQSISSPPSISISS